MAVMAVHEIGPGHCSHALMMGQVDNPVRKTLWSELFFEGWAHYAEEMMWEAGYQDDTAHYQFGMAQEAMIRTVRVEAVLGMVAPFESSVLVLTREGYTRTTPGDYGFMVGNADTTLTVEELFDR